jgi:hypothetical protein
LTRLRCPWGNVRSNGFLPVSNSSRTMPKLYTSLLSVIRPVMAYLNIRCPISIGVQEPSKFIKLEQVITTVRSMPARGEIRAGFGTYSGAW